MGFAGRAGWVWDTGTRYWVCACESWRRQARAMVMPPSISVIALLLRQYENDFFFFFAVVHKLSNTRFSRAACTVVSSQTQRWTVDYGSLPPPSPRATTALANAAFLLVSEEEAVKYRG